MIKSVAITGGTHGNELVGIYLVKYLQKNPELVQRKSLDVSLHLLNKQAISECRRYIDRDLNRCFSTSRLSDATLFSYEDQLAKEINQLLGPKGSGSTKADFIVDLHTTTANMGLTIVVSNESNITWKAIAYLKMMVPELNIYKWCGDEEDSFVDSIAPHGFAIEVGAVPQGVLRADLYEKTKKLILHLLDYLDMQNSEDIDLLPNVEVFEHEMLVDYPRDANGEITAMVHPDRQDRDYDAIYNGDAIFMDFDGESLFYEGEEMYALFINEAAYYEKGIAMTLAKKRVKEIS